MNQLFPVANFTTSNAGDERYASTAKASVARTAAFIGLRAFNIAANFRCEAPCSDQRAFSVEANWSRVSPDAIAGTVTAVLRIVYPQYLAIAPFLQKPARLQLPSVDQQIWLFMFGGTRPRRQSSSARRHHRQCPSA